jgi:hypothetical protein
MDVVVKFKLCDKIKCSECVQGYTITRDGKVKFGCRMMDAIVSVPKFADSLEKFSRMDWKQLGDMAIKAAGEIMGGKKDEGQDSSEKPS